jgi:uncharacterized protein (DUF1697 family)
VPRYAAFLRGVNLASKRRVSNSDLVTLCEGLDFDEVAAFRTSGNVIFDASRTAEAKLADRVETALAKSLGFEVKVFLRTAAQIHAIAEQKPFSEKQMSASKRKLQVLLLDRKPSAKKRESTLDEQTDEDLLTFGDRELYWLPRAGTQESTLNRKAVEDLIGPTTGRTKSMIEEIEAKFFQ